MPNADVIVSTSVGAGVIGITLATITAIVILIVLVAIISVIIGYLLLSYYQKRKIKTKWITYDGTRKYSTI